MKARDHEVGAVGLLQEVKAQAAEVTRMFEQLSLAQELAHEGSAAGLGVAAAPGAHRGPDPGASLSLADRLRVASQGLDWEARTERARPYSRSGRRRTGPRRRRLHTNGKGNCRGSRRSMHYETRSWSTISEIIR